jgi:hypothetical protein
MGAGWSRVSSRPPAFLVGAAVALIAAIGYFLLASAAIPPAESAQPIAAVGGTAWAVDNRCDLSAIRPSMATHWLVRDRR